MDSLAGKRVWVAGHRGMVGSAIVRLLAKEDCEIVTVERREVDLTDQRQVRDWMMEARPQAVFLAAAKVGGILANDSHPAEFIYDNLMIEANVIDSAYRSGVEKLLFLGSSCIYPKMAPQPIPERALLTGPLEQTNEWYAIAKIAGLKLAEAYSRQYGCRFTSVMPANLYGPGDNFDLQSSHVIPALIRKAHAAKTDRTTLTIWGSGSPRREFLHVEDCASACLFLMKTPPGASYVNAGFGEDLTIRELAELVADVVGFDGPIEWDREKPDGTPRKLLDSSHLLGLGWRPSKSLREGLAETYEWFLQKIEPTL